ncbi:hypothetical protein POTOM_031017 [Populus tomentosa]|uniref:MIF4G domain-containing protein n=1 Tax=Populus tomentosa TaxID=118781 RepID=A0A8X7Z716_POPTO|nr:hypothetical protein POTOM_031017 [Populus tomentosa]
MDHQEDESRGGSVTPRKQDDEEAVARLEEMKKSIEAKVALRQSNLNPERPGFDIMLSVVSHEMQPSFSINRIFNKSSNSIAVVLAAVVALQDINEEQKEGLMEDLRNVNLSKFVSEAVTSICDAKLRTSDIQAAVQLLLIHSIWDCELGYCMPKIMKISEVICSLLHQRYKDFSPSLVQGLLKVFFPGKSGEDLDLDKNSKAMKKRSTLKLLLELYFVGVTEDSSIFINIIKDLTSIENLKDRDTTQTNLTLLASFARQGRVFLGLPLSGQETQEEFLKGLSITTDQKKIFRKAFHTYYDVVAELLQSEHALASSADGFSLDIQILHISLAEALDMQPPVMPEDGHTTRVTSGEDASSPAAGKDTSLLEALWDDEDTRAFYECLPDLRAFVPAVLLGEAEPKANEHSAKTQDQPSLVNYGCFDSSSVKMLLLHSRKRSLYLILCIDVFIYLKELAPESDQGQPTQDMAEVDFCYLNSKSSRKKLVRALFNVPRTSLELLPYYSRMVATLSTCMKDVSSMLLQLLEEEFNFLINKKDQMNIETKIRNSRFIGELCKFRIAPASTVFSCLKACLDDFTHHNIDVACNLLETCGRFLYRSPETTVRMANMLEILMRLKNVKNLDPRHSTLVENAYYLCKPPERSARVSKVRPPLYQYIRKLLFSDLDKSSIEHVLRQLRKLPWSECEAYLLKCFMKVHKGKYGQIHLIASLTAGLSRYHDEFAVAVVDEVLEEIRLGLELNDYGMQQRRIAHMRFLGELYNYEHVDSSVIFETLYWILVFGHDTPEQDMLDPPEDCFRIRMVITLLDTCGHYFDRGSSKRKLNRFLMHFQRYILSKGLLPLDVEFDLQDLFAELRPNMIRYSSIEEVNAALIELEENERTVSTDKFNSEKHSDTDKPLCRTTSSTISANGQSIFNGNEENGSHEDNGGSDTDSGSGTIDQDGHDEEEFDEENHDGGVDTEDEDDDGDGPASEEEDEVHVRQKVAEVDPLEVANFEQELRAESMEQRRQELRGRPALNMVIPMNLFEGSAKDHHGRAVGGESGDEDEDAGGNKDVQVKVLVKRGNKQQAKQLYIPRDCSLVQSTKQKEAAEFEEKQDIKRLVLEYNDREEEENNGLGTQTLNWMPAGTSRVTSRGSTWEGSSGRGTGSRYRHHHHSGSGLHGRRRSVLKDNCNHILNLVVEKLSLVAGRILFPSIDNFARLISGILEIRFSPVPQTVRQIRGDIIMVNEMTLEFVMEM